jgi:hypothetical protein
VPLSLTSRQEVRDWVMPSEKADDSVAERYPCGFSCVGTRIQDMVLCGSVTSSCICTVNCYFTTMLLAPIVKIIRSYDATEWEIFIGEWQKGLTKYAEVKRLGGAGDHGRDVVGLVTTQGCEGVWDNYQCKHYEKPLDFATGIIDIGKIIFHSYGKKFSPPRRMIFVAPRGVGTKFRDFLLNPTKLRSEVLSNWDMRIAKLVAENEVHQLKGGLLDWATGYDFTSFGYATIDEVLDDHRKTAYWASRFGGMLPAPPKGVTPATISEHETSYISKLIKVYEKSTGQQIGNVASLLKSFPQEADDLWNQRVRFYDAEAFSAHFRDQTEPGTVEDFADQIHDAVAPGLKLGISGAERLNTALTTATMTKTISVLEPQARPRVKQGVCHQLANGNKLDWS